MIHEYNHFDRSRKVRNLQIRNDQGEDMHELSFEARAYLQIEEK